jgi:hypothetical protein
MNSKRLTALFLLALISFKLLVVPFVYLDFELRKEYIIHNLCENRLKPQLHCDGKCYLAKQLQKVAEDNARNETQKQSDTTKKLLQEVFEEINVDFLTVPQLIQADPTFPHIQSLFSAFFLKALIKPPIA